MRRYRSSLFLLGVLAGLTSCAATMTRPPTICETIRRAVSDGSMPLEIARGWYPECHVTDAPTK